MFVFKINPAWHSDENGIKPGSNQKMTDKHAAEYTKVVCCVVNESVCNAEIAYTTR